MANAIETREYVDGPRSLAATIMDNGCVCFAVTRTDGANPAVSATVLRQLADLADAAQAPGTGCTKT
jgi:hypothetical protein